MRLISGALGLFLLWSATHVPRTDAAVGHAEARARKDQQKQKRLTDDQIRKILIEASIAAYSGSCPCPYSTARNGSRCGRRSAYSREGGEQPLCYPKDVSAQRVQDYRDAHPADD